MPKLSDRIVPVVSSGGSTPLYSRATLCAPASTRESTLAPAASAATPGPALTDDACCAGPSCCRTCVQSAA
eukprot:1734613-Pleurochrysis_carterae.AAC.1